MNSVPVWHGSPAEMDRLVAILIRNCRQRPCFDGEGRPASVCLTCDSCSIFFDQGTQDRLAKMRERRFGLVAMENSRAGGVRIK